MNCFCQKMKSAFLLSGLLLLFCSTPVSAANTAGSVSNTGFYLDTVITITVYGTEDPAIIDDCFALISSYEKMFSRTIEGSDIWNVNHAQGQPVEVSDETAELIRLSMEYSEISGGAFDITLAPCSILWDFQNNTGTIPDSSDLEEAISHVGMENLHIDDTAVTLDDPEAAIDLGGIAKGYIADRVKDFLISEGYTSALINLGGNVLTVGTKPDGSNWKIGVRKPFAAANDTAAILSVKNQSVVTSGTYERYFETDDVIYHHILDPKTGFPTQNSLESVTILSDFSVDGDALSTTCFVLGPEKGMELIESLEHVEALLITDDGTLHTSSGFPN